MAPDIDSLVDGQNDAPASRSDIPSRQAVFVQTLLLTIAGSGATLAMAPTFAWAAWTLAGGTLPAAIFLAFRLLDERPQRKAADAAPAAVLGWFLGCASVLFVGHLLGGA